MRRGTRRTAAWNGAGLLVTGLLLGWPVSAVAETRWAVIVSGASGGEKYAEQMRSWRQALRSALIDRYRFEPSRVRELVDESAGEGLTATAANVRSVLSDVRKAAGRDDLILIVLLGHGTFDGEVAKFNLVGPDLTAQEWQQMLGPIPGRLVVVNTTSSSFPFLDALKGKSRVVITATNSAAQKYATVFPEYFARALGEGSTDLDKNGRTSILEVFEATSLAVKQHYEQRGQLTTERARLDDVGDGIGREQGAETTGGLARLWHLDPDAAATADPELAALIRQQRVLETEAEALRQRRGELPAAEWQDAYEKLMVELARISQEIRRRSP